MLKEPEPLDFTNGPELSVLIFLMIAAFALAEGYLRLRGIANAHWARMAAYLVLVLFAFAWILFGGWAYEPWYFTLAISLLLIAAAWSLASPIAPNYLVEGDARKSGARTSP